MHGKVQDYLRKEKSKSIPSENIPKINGDMKAS